MDITVVLNNNVTISQVSEADPTMAGPEIELGWSEATCFSAAVVVVMDYPRPPVLNVHILRINIIT